MRILEALLKIWLERELSGTHLNILTTLEESDFQLMSWKAKFNVKEEINIKRCCWLKNISECTGLDNISMFIKIEFIMSETNYLQQTQSALLIFNNFWTHVTQIPLMLPIVLSLMLTSEKLYLCAVYVSYSDISQSQKCYQKSEYILL